MSIRPVDDVADYRTFVRGFKALVHVLHAYPSDRANMLQMIDALLDKYNERFPCGYSS